MKVLSFSSYFTSSRRDHWFAWVSVDLSPEHLRSHFFSGFDTEVLPTIAGCQDGRYRPLGCVAGLTGTTVDVPSSRNDALGEKKPPCCLCNKRFIAA